MDIFKLNNNEEIELTPWVFNFEKVYRIWRRDNSDEKSKAREELSYIYLMYSIDSPYVRQDDEEERHKEVLAALGLSGDWQPDRWLKEAIKLFIDVQETPTVAYLKVSQRVLNSLREEMSKIDFKSNRNGQNAGKLKVTPEEVRKHIEEAVKAEEMIGKLREKVVNERSQKKKSQGKTKAGAKQSRYVDPAKIRKIRDGGENKGSE